MRAGLAFLLALAPLSVSAQSVVTSSAPHSSSVTVYRGTGEAGGSLNLDWLQGYALISETRRISLPAGTSVVRFEGVADGMIAVSAVVSGLPGGVIEKNRDARLLSPASLLDGSLGNRVHIRRTNPSTGKVSETDAVIRSGADGAVVLQTAEGVEALRCSGLPETIVYDMVPQGLSTKPTFSVQTNSPRAMEAEVTLTYLANGFDWGAAYLAKVAEDGKTLDLSAWLTVANGNGAAYEGAQLLAVAGVPNRTSDFRALGEKPEALSLNLQCWPMDGTSTYPGWGLPPPAPPPPPMMYPMAASEIIVTAQKRSESLQDVIAAQENLGDLKLYRVPVPVDVLPNAQKQVLLLRKDHVPFTRYYGMTLGIEDTTDGSRALYQFLRMQNKAKEGLGLPMPAGGIVVMQARGDADLLLGQSLMLNRAVGEKFEVDAGQSDQVRIEQTELQEEGKARRFRVTLTNALDRPAPVEITLQGLENYGSVKFSAKLTAKGADRLWALTVPANGTASLEYSLKQN